MCGPVLSSDVVKTRKDHNCWGCTKILPKGTQCMRVASVDMGSVSSAYWCDDCMQISIDRSYDSCFGYGELRQIKDYLEEEMRA